MYFEYKHVETKPNCSHELATFLKYHMPLSQFIFKIEPNDFSQNK